MTPTTKPPNYRPVVTTSVASQIADAIQQAILDGALRTNDRLPNEEDLAAQFGVSRPTVREALKRLAARHLVRSRRGPAGGNFINGPSPEELAQSLGTAATLLVATGGVSLEEMAVARFEMEAICCRMAAVHVDAGQIAGLRQEITQQCDPAISDQDFCASDVRFHRLVVQAGRNPILRFVMNLVVESLMPVSNMIIVRVRDRKTIAGFHERMVDALEQRDGEGAVAELNALIVYIRSQYELAERKSSERPVRPRPNNRQAVS